jgi:hypothetical protein
LSHWLDDAARGLSEGRYNRRQVLRRGGAVAAGTLAASVTGPLAALTRATAAAAGVPCPDFNSPCLSPDTCCGGQFCLRTLAAGDRNAVITQPSSAVAAPASSMAVASAVVTTAATTRGSRSAAPACAARAIALLRPRQGSPAVRTAEVPPERPPVQDQGIREWVAAEATSLDAYATTAASVPQTPAAATFLAGAKIPVRSGAWCGRQGWVEATVK